MSDEDGDFLIMGVRARDYPKDELPYLPIWLRCLDLTSAQAAWIDNEIRRLGQEIEGK